jgi:4-amino-4-deoxy-L-arabinose transferase-like glycosyltransferase
MPNKYILALILIIAIAIFFRFWQFNSIPPGLYQDEAMNGTDALKSLKSGEFGVFYANNNGREGMIVWLDALAIRAFGTKPWVLRIFPALAGILAVLGLYFLAKELFNPEIALASGFFMAASFWAVNFSRIGFRAGLMIPFLILSFYFLLRGFKEVRLQKSPKSDFWLFAIAGILFGLGFYTYISYRFAPLLALLVFLPVLIKQKSKKLWLGVLVFMIATFLVALPIGLYFFNNPSDFFGRSSEVSIFSSNSPLFTAFVSLVKTLGMFNVAGDFNWRHNYAGSPELFWLIGILFLLGIYLSFKKFSFSEKFILAWLGIFLLPNILTTEGNPHALRALGAMPAAMIFAGIGLIWVCVKIKKYLNDKISNPKLVEYYSQLLRIKKELFILLVVFLFFISFVEFNKYFVKWASNPQTAAAFSQSQVTIADYLNNLPPEVEKYAIWSSDDRPTDNDLPVSAQTVYFLTYGKEKVTYLRSDELNKIKLGASGTVIIPLYFNLDLLHKINKQFSKSKIEVIGLNTGAVIVP